MESMCSLPGRGLALLVLACSSGSELGKGIESELPLCGLENPLGAGDTEPKERSQSKVRIFSGSGGCWGS